MRWSLGDERRLPSIQGIVRYCEHFPEIRAILIERLVGVCEGELAAILHNLTCFDLPHPFTQQRAEIVAFLTLRRRERLLQALEN
jgi:hypothetical protein